VGLIVTSDLLQAFAIRGSAWINNSAIWRPGNIAAAAIVSLFVSGCAIGKSVDNLASEPALVTGSITENVETEGVHPTDAEAIKLAVTDAQEATPENNLLAWSNPETGNSGTITAIDNYIGTDGQSCKKFRTTVDSFMGISLYNGETCELKKGFWVLSWFIRDKSD
jgi:surface antigen